MVPRRRAKRRPSGVKRNFPTQKEKLSMQRNPLLQGPRAPEVQGPRLAIPKGPLSAPQAAPTTTRPAPGPDIWNPGSYQGGRPPMPKGSGNPLKFMTDALALLGGQASTALAVMNPTPLGRGDLRAALERGDYKPMQGPPAPKAPQKEKLSAGAMAFDRAFAKARSQGLSEFTWRGKRYNTKLK